MAADRAGDGRPGNGGGRVTGAVGDFEPFPKIGRLVRGIVVTEKIDGSNGQIAISDDLSVVRAGSRTRWIEPGKATDNYGFAAWVAANADELRQLAPGRHFGEWWGSGINRGYGLTGGEKRFSLFNTGRWSSLESRPACCGVVPVLYAGPFGEDGIASALHSLVRGGSVAAPGFMDPEGVVVFHSATGTLFKRTIKNDDAPKGLAEAA